MPLLFSYGTLQQPQVQLETFGRLLEGQADILPGFKHGLVQINDAQVAATTGMTHYDNACFTGNHDDQMPGTVFKLSDSEMTIADIYEQRAAYKRTEVSLLSGSKAWVYVEQSTLP